MPIVDLPVSTPLIGSTEKEWIISEAYKEIRSFFSHQPMTGTLDKSCPR